MSGLKPCPFCGSDAEVNFGSKHGAVWAYVTCACGVRTCNYHGESDRKAKKEAAEAWNRRTDDGN